MNKNKNLGDARKAKKDEFYTSVIMFPFIFIFFNFSLNI